jgi:hypothetical protein
LRHATVQTDAKIAEFALDILAWYASQKDDIPMDSKWWPKRPENVDWLTADYLQLDAALNARVRMPPFPENDRLWVERILARVVREATQRLGDAGADEALAATVESLASRTSHAAYACCVDEALLVARAAFDALLPYCDNAPDALDDRQVTVQLAAADALGVCCANIILGLYRRLRETSSEAIGQAVRELRDGRRSPNLWLPFEVRALLDRADDTWHTERKVYGHTITPPEFFAGECEASFSKAFLRNASRAVTTARVLLLPVAKNRTSVLGKGLILQGAIDVSTRGIRLVELLQESLSSDEVKTAAPRLVKTLRADFDEALDQFSHNALQPDQPKGTEYPDFLGQAYHFCAERLFEAILQADLPAIARFSQRVFDLSFAGIARLAGAASHVHTTLWVRQIVEDIFDLSGYAILTSRISRKNLWGPLRVKWGDYVDKRGNDAFEMACRFYAQSLTPAAISPRSLLRHSWGLKFQEYLAAQGLFSTDLYGNSIIAATDRNQRPDPLLLALMSYRSIETEKVAMAFIHTYIRRVYPSYVTIFGDDIADYARQVWRNVR